MSLPMLFRDVHWLILICLLSTGLTSPVVADIEHGLISLTTHLNTTHLTLPLCDHPYPGHQPTLIDCTAAVNIVRFVPDAYTLKVWAAGATTSFRATWRSCQVYLLPVDRHSEDTFTLIDLANTASGIIGVCRQWETGTTLGGSDLVGPKAVFQIVVAYVEPNQIGNRG